MSDKLVLAVPSKGRLQENANAFFARAGLAVTTGRGARDYRGDSIRRRQCRGRLSVGFGNREESRFRRRPSRRSPARIWCARRRPSSKVVLLTQLGFGHANVVVAVPQAWIDVRNMADLEDVALSFRARRGERMRVATKYVNTTRAFFRDKGVSDYHIVESLGATEGAPAAGQAELIVDITSTGATLVANGLKVLDDGVILRSEANLVASLGRALDAGTSEKSPGKSCRGSPPRKRRAALAKSSRFWTRSPKALAERRQSLRRAAPPSRRQRPRDFRRAEGPGAGSCRLADRPGRRGSRRAAGRLCLHPQQSALRAFDLAPRRRGRVRPGSNRHVCRDTLFRLRHEPRRRRVGPDNSRAGLKRRNAQPYMRRHEFMERR